MQDNWILLLFLGLIFGVIWWILYVLLAKYLKGEIKINLIKRNYIFWEIITGTFRLHAKKEIVWDELSIHLVAYRRETSYTKDGGKQSRKVEFVRYSQSVESGVRYEMWLKKEYDIKIQIPSKDKIFLGQSEIDFGDGTLGKLAKFALTNTKRTQLSWQVQVDLEAEGLDIHGKKDIFVTE